MAYNKNNKARHWTYCWMGWIWFLRQITWYDCPHHPFQGGREYIGRPCPKSHITSKLNENEKTYISVTDLEIGNSLPQWPSITSRPLYTWVVKLYNGILHSLIEGTFELWVKVFIQMKPLLVHYNYSESFKILKVDKYFNKSMFSQKTASFISWQR